MTQRHSLANGLSWAHVPLSRHMATIVALVAVGSRHERAANVGVAHILEHVIFKGTSQWRDATSWDRAVEALGADFNAFTTPDYTYFVVNVPAHNFDAAMAMLADLLRAARLDGTEFDSEKRVIREELLERQEPGTLCQDEAEEAVFMGKGIGWKTSAAKRNLSRVSMAAVRNFYRAWYVPGNVAVVTGGSLREEAVADSLKAHFGQWHAGAAADGLEPARVAAAGALVTKDLPYKTANVMMALPVPAAHDGRAAWNAWAAMFGGGMQSRLYQAVREHAGLAYSVGAYMTWFRDAGYLGISFEATSGNALKALKAVSAELAALSSDRPFTEGELAVALGSLRGTLLRRADDAEETLLAHARHFMLGYPDADVDAAWRAYEKLVIGDIHAVTRAVAAGDAWQRVWVGSAPDRKKILAAC